MSKNFKQYLVESQKVFKARIKTIHPTTDVFMEKLTTFLQRYNVLSISEPVKTVLQRRPLDFPEVQNAEVYIIDCTFASPISSYVLRTELQAYLVIAMNTITVRGDNEPVELQNTEMAQRQDIQDQAVEKNLTPASLLSTDSIYPASEFTAPGQNYFGNTYTERFLKALNVDAEKRQHEQEKVDGHSSLFSWLDMPKEQEPLQPSENFNADVDALKVVTPGNEENAPKKRKDKDAKVPAPEGNFQSAEVNVKKDYWNKNGKVKTLSAKK